MGPGTTRSLRIGLVSSIRAKLVVTALVLLVAPTAHASDPPPTPPPDVQIAPFAGLQFGGSVQGASGRKASFSAGLDYGVMVDFRVADSWYVEAMYSRQESELTGSFEATVERYMAGVVEERDYDRTKFFGVALLGGTRFVPGFSGYGSSALFTIGLGLGVKHFVSDRFALRADVRGLDRKSVV